jgi:hypothetical protein
MNVGVRAHCSALTGELDLKIQALVDYVNI